MMNNRYTNMYSNYDYANMRYNYANMRKNYAKIRKAEIRKAKIENLKYSISFHILSFLASIGAGALFGIVYMIFHFFLYD